MLNVLDVLNVLKIPKDPSLACWALLKGVSAKGATVFGVFSILLYRLRMADDALLSEMASDR